MTCASRGQYVAVTAIPAKAVMVYNPYLHPWVHHSNSLLDEDHDALPYSVASVI